MTMVEEICATAALFAGDAESSALLVLSKAAEADLCARLRPGVAPEDCREVFVLAAAYLALADLGPTGNSEGVTAFTAGDVSVTRGAASAQRELRERAAVLMAPYCRDSFCFAGVRG